MESLKAKQAHLLEYVPSKKIKISYHETPTSLIEGVLARGDRRLNHVLLDAWKLGCKFGVTNSILMPGCRLLKRMVLIRIFIHSEEDRLTSFYLGIILISVSQENSLKMRTKKPMKTKRHRIAELNVQAAVQIF